MTQTHNIRAYELPSEISDIKAIALASARATSGDLSKVIRILNILTGESTKDIGDKAGLSAGYVENMLRGKRSIKPAVKKLIQEKYGLDLIAICNFEKRQIELNLNH